MTTTRPLHTDGHPHAWETIGRFTIISTSFPPSFQSPPLKITSLFRCIFLGWPSAPLAGASVTHIAFKTNTFFWFTNEPANWGCFEGGEWLVNIWISQADRCRGVGAKTNLKALFFHTWGERKLGRAEAPSVAQSIWPRLGHTWSPFDGSNHQLTQRTVL